MKPAADRSYFYLVYATQHWKGVEEFRRVEKKAIDAQEYIRDAVKLSKRSETTGMDDLFGAAPVEGNTRSYEHERQQQLERATERLGRFLADHPNGVYYEDLLGEVMQTPMVWKSDFDGLLRELRDSGKIRVPDLPANQKTLKPTSQSENSKARQ